MVVFRAAMCEGAYLSMKNSTAQPYNPVWPLCDRILRSKCLGKNEKLVLLCMVGSNANPDGTNIHVSVKELGELTGIWPQNLPSIIDSLVKRGFLVEDGYARHTKRYIMPYKAHFPDFIPPPKFARKIQLEPAPLEESELVNHDERRLEDTPEEMLKRRIRAYKRQIAMQSKVTIGGDAWQQAEYAKRELEKLGINWKV